MVLKKNYILSLNSEVFERLSEMFTSKEQIRSTLQFLFDTGENSSPAVENVSRVSGSDTGTVYHAQI